MRQSTIFIVLSILFLSVLVAPMPSHKRLNVDPHRGKVRRLFDFALRPDTDWPFREHGIMLPRVHVAMGRTTQWYPFQVRCMAQETIVAE